MQTKILGSQVRGRDSGKIQWTGWGHNQEKTNSFKEGAKAIVQDERRGSKTGRASWVDWEQELGK